MNGVVDYLLGYYDARIEMLVERWGAYHVSVKEAERARKTLLEYVNGDRGVRN